MPAKRIEPQRHQPGGAHQREHRHRAGLRGCAAATSCAGNARPMSKRKAHAAARIRRGIDPHAGSEACGRLRKAEELAAPTSAIHAAAVPERGPTPTCTAAHGRGVWRDTDGEVDFLWLAWARAARSPAPEGAENAQAFVKVVSGTGVTPVLPRAKGSARHPGPRAGFVPEVLNPAVYTRFIRSKMRTRCRPPREMAAGRPAGGHHRGGGHLGAAAGRAR